MSEVTREHLAALIGNDSHAASFQSLGQYRTALLKEIAQASAAPEQEAVEPKGGTFCRICATKLCVTGVCTIYCPNRDCGVPGRGTKALTKPELELLKAGQPVFAETTGEYPEPEPAEPVVIEVQNGCVYLISKPLEPGRHKLYTHPSAEIERLRADLDTMRRKNNEYCDELMADRQRLAKAQGLLRERDRLIYGVIGATGKKRAEYLSKLHDLVSATAQPAEVKS